MVVSLWILALFGIISLTIRIFAGFRWLGKSGKGRYSIIISAKNQEETIEGIIRGFILRAGFNGQEETLFNVVLVDADSSDNTPEVMKRLAREYYFIKFVPCKELSSYLKNLWCRGDKD
jgi:cellulose synthase/poly-beta-1,6-N-acetylglucosamine synthase-like glycosyltransferase